MVPQRQSLLPRIKDDAEHFEDETLSNTVTITTKSTTVTDKKTIYPRCSFIAFLVVVVVVVAAVVVVVAPCFLISFGDDAVDEVFDDDDFVIMLLLLLLLLLL
jgi:hypothetical protein